ncbi:hypothetical protein [Devosia sp. Root105]|uniref:hypothetical protein n=1 Tax=Devosia sp. Root105 TaxID=1736423 RepID=UPI0006FA1252|nr:hypothetical protein [Devosia sp. Root105]KQU92850.1 hypothetical protein ASC68_23735 [Devosia sp. Root105]
MLRYRINLLEDGSVVSDDGEYLGIWDTDENDHPSFYPDGHAEALLFDVSIPALCWRIEEWLDARASK